jgi:hypothetical protein
VDGLDVFLGINPHIDEAGQRGSQSLSECFVQVFRFFHAETGPAGRGGELGEAVVYHCEPTATT